MSAISNYQQNIQNQGRPPYIRFEERLEEDRDASIKANRYVHKRVDYVIIQSPGSKDTCEKIVSEWLTHCESLAMMEPPQWPVQWVEGHREMYQKWLKGQEVSPLGFSVRMWPAIDKATAENLCMTNVLTVEDLATANEETMRRIGMGARQLKEKAKAWLEAGRGSQAEEVAALRAQVSDLVQAVQTERDKRESLEHRLAHGAAAENESHLSKGGKGKQVPGQE
jgi:hypothetical protein